MTTWLLAGSIVAVKVPSGAGAGPRTTAPCTVKSDPWQGHAIGPPGVLGRDTVHAWWVHWRETANTDVAERRVTAYLNERHAREIAGKPVASLR